MKKDCGCGEDDAKPEPFTTLAHGKKLDSVARVVDGKKMYFCCDSCADDWMKERKKKVA